ncbi:Mitochondrial ribosomal protein of the small subunit [Sugiyamaella lignohabitans]|uniref:Mitochondrial ribosomal protein of the small subunit n=1 Tax=Sugiyamaella lignohabitans TaxID=796027 RepID=A0A167FKT4_9ASCO|nr:Mitochondrial ribosomal protein of the small subunit [Sugiyamaella lignohabitans]ANB15426.1 Mitochondrial ribosomal protein of the small subunit [Sugiyamaella lignohabitans]
MSNLLSASKARISEVLRLQASIFRTTYNPDMVRNGAKVLRRKLRGDLIKEYYYPSKTLPNASALNRMFPDLHCIDPKEYQRLQKNAE